MAQLLSEDGTSLTIGQAASLRGWARRQLSAPAPRPGRPRLDLRGIARELLLYATGPGFRRRLTFERLMSRHVSPDRRRDLRPPGFLQLDLAERFPRLLACGSDAAPEDLFGPFRDRGAAARARDALHRLALLRPCDESFEPDPALPLGLGCVYAQIRSCSAPCLCRVSEEGYRELASRLDARLAGPRDDTEALPPWVGRVASRAVVAERDGPRVTLYPVRSLAVLEGGAVQGSLPEAADRLAWPAPPAPMSDAVWLSDWLGSRERSAAWVWLERGASAQALVASALGLPERD